MLAGALLISYCDGKLLFANEICKCFGLNKIVGGNELQLCAMMYALFMSSTFVRSKCNENLSQLHWIKAVCSFTSIDIQFIFHIILVGFCPHFLS